MSNRISLLIKPSSSLCNMSCKYCFYKDVASLRENYSFNIMNEETINNIAKRLFEYDFNEIDIAFQGGEPLMVGLSFYEKFVYIIAKHNKNNVTINYSLQTNGTLITKEFASFFKQHNFLIGVSLDGYEAIHNQLRLLNEKESFSKVMEGINLLKEFDVSFNILTVVSKYIANKPDEIFSFYKQQGFKFLQFIPLIDDFDGKQSSFSLTSLDYGKFLARLYDLYFLEAKNNNYISVRLFDNLIYRFKGLETEECDLNGICSINFVIESNGNIYPCDFYCLDKYKMGNINSDSLKELFETNVAKNFVKESLNINKECLSCKYLNICRSGCRRYKKDNKYIYCESIKMLVDEMLTLQKEVN